MRPALGAAGLAAGDMVQEQQPSQRLPPAQQPTQPAYRPGCFDDDFVLSIMMGTDFKSLQRQAAAAAAATATTDIGAATRAPQQPNTHAGGNLPPGAATAARGGGGRRPASAASDLTSSAARGEAIDRLKGLRCAGA
jgi:hypothetical protein